MKYLKMLGLAVGAVVAMTAFVGAGSASASVLCSTNTNPCTSKWASGTQVEFTLRSGTSAAWRTTEGATIKTCTTATLKGKLVQGSATETAKLAVTASEFQWNGCTVPTVTLQGGEVEFHNIAGTANGTVTLKGFKFTTNGALEGSCSYGMGTGVDLGTVTASSTGDAIIDGNALLTERSNVLCCPDVVWVEEFTLTAPKGTGFYVEPS